MFLIAMTSLFVAAAPAQEVVKNTETQEIVLSEECENLSEEPCSEEIVFEEDASEDSKIEEIAFDEE